jgi:hypothetical protein
VRTMGWRRLAEGQLTGHYSLPVVTARSGGEKGRHDSVGGALDGDGEVAKRRCDGVKVQWWVELGVPMLRGAAHHRDAWGGRGGRGDPRRW